MTGDGRNERAPARLLEAAIEASRGGRRAEAEALCREILTLQPGSLPATHLLAILAAQGGRHEMAIRLLREVVARMPGSAEALNQLAALLRLEGQAAEAVSLSRRAASLRPADPATLENAGLACLADGRFSEAEAWLARAVALNPGSADAQYHHGLALRAAGRGGEAVVAFRQASALAPDAVHIRLALAACLTDAGDHAAAESCLRRGLQRAPNDPDLDHRLGIFLQQNGRFDEAVACFQRAIAAAPHRTAAYLDLVYSKKIGEADRPLIGRMASLLDGGGLADEAAANLHFALGKAFDDLDAPGEAMRHLDEANRLKRATLQFDRERHGAMVDWLVRTFTAEYWEGRQALGSTSELPTLIVGMMRSGTTLVEQILSSHPHFAAAGELAFWARTAEQLGAALEGGIDATRASAVVDAYLCRLREAGPQARRISDKMPHNFLRLGLVHLFFPQARIIHCRRDPIDTCLSIYATQFTEPQDFAYDRGDIVFFYEHYLRVMDHWRRVLPADRLLEVDYEELVAEPEAVSRRMVAFCGLDWDPACLRPERNRRMIGTASMWQARQPIYGSSVARWRRYEPWLGEFRALPRSEPERHGTEPR